MFFGSTAAKYVQFLVNQAYFLNEINICFVFHLLGSIF